MGGGEVFGVAEEGAGDDGGGSGGSEEWDGVVADGAVGDEVDFEVVEDGVHVGEAVAGAVVEGGAFDAHGGAHEGDGGDVGAEGFDGLDGGIEFEGDSGEFAGLFDAVDGMIDAFAGFDGEGDAIDAGFEECGEEVHGPGGEEVEVEGALGEGAKAGDEIGEEEQGRDVMAVGRV